MILITGGLGFIGSHTITELSEYNILVIDNLSNSKIEIKDKIENIIKKQIKFEYGCLTDDLFLSTCFRKYKIEKVIHFAAFKNVNESIHEPLKYYHNNLVGLLNLLKKCEEYKVKNFIFSSSCTVYGNKNKTPLIEKSVNNIDSTSIINPYGMSKYMSEKILEDYAKITNMVIISLRYFNPVGAHISGKLGEDENGNNLMPIIMNCCKNKKKIKIFGKDYETMDGTCIRDYIHIMDLAKGHKIALETDLEKGENHIFNLGTGKGTSVLELINAMKKHIHVDYEYVNRREGDLEKAYSDVNKSFEILGFKSEYTIKDICEHTYQHFILNG